VQVDVHHLDPGHRLEALFAQFARVQRAVAESSSQTEVFDAIVAGTAELFEAEYATLRMLDPEDPGTMTVVAHRGIERELRRQTRRAPVGEGASGIAVAERRVVVVEDYEALGERSALAATDVRSAMGAPVYVLGELAGVLLVATAKPGRRFAARDGELFERFAGQVSLALGAARAAEHERQAFRDPLTGLPNRALFLQRLDQALVRADRSGHDVAVLFVDLDRFKPVNDTLGHDAGDGLIVDAAHRIQGCLRFADTAARIGGDEFAILLAEGTTDPAVVAQRIIDGMTLPFQAGEQEVFVGVSIGICRGRAEADELLANADVAMYAAKSRGRGCFAEYQAGMRSNLATRLSVEFDLRRAIGRDELELHYQPIFDLPTGRIASLEALVRWRHPTRGLLFPGDFLPLAEETGLIVELDRLALAKACEDLAGWLRSTTQDQLTVSVNLSAQDILDDGLAEHVEQALGGRLHPSRLTLELTESRVLENSAAARLRLDELRRLGVRLAIDDFGTGYSSLRYLADLPVDVLKLPRPFVEGLGENRRIASIARSVAELGRSLGLATVAEGVETEEELAALRELGYEHGQGYLLGRPGPAEHVPALLGTALAA
jgi:diguanylate cyclase (GGDEF)-like protein